MNKPLLPQYPQRRISLRETALALLALGCAAGWLNERINHRSSEEVKEFVDGLRQVQRDPGAVVDVVVYKGGFSVSCLMRRFDPGPPPAEASTEAPTAEQKASERPAAAAPDVQRKEPAAQPKKPAEQPAAAEPATEDSP